MKLRQTGLIVAVAAATFLAGCAAGGAKPDPLSEDRTKQEIKVYITNLAFMDATVYGVINGARRRLGRAAGKREVVLTMPLHFSSEMYMEIDILAGPKCRTERMVVDPGDHLELIIRTDNPNWSCGGS